MHPCNKHLLKQRAHLIERYLNHLERYVRNPDALSEAQQTAWTNLMESDPSAKTIADFYAAFYQELEHLDHTPSPRVQAFADGLFDTPRPAEAPTY